MAEPAERQPLNLTRLAAWIAAFLLVAAVALAADLVTKHLAWDHFVADAFTGDDGRVRLVGTGEPEVTVIPHGLRLVAVANEGAALGLGQGMQNLFLAVSAAATVVLLGFFAHSLLPGRTPGGPLRRGLYRLTLAILLAGVVGNFYDRVVFGYVRDMLHMLPGVRWADLLGALPAAEVFPWVFNLADVYLCCGVATIALFGFFPPKEPAADD